MNFADFEAAFIRENRKLKSMMALGLLFSAISTTLVLMGKSYVVHQGGSIFEERLLAEDVCKDGLLSIAKGTPNKVLVSKDILPLLIKDPFIFNVEKVLRVESLERGACKIILRADGKLNSFKIGLIEGKELPFYYQIQQIDEIPLKEDEI